MIMLGPKIGSLYWTGNGPCSNGDAQNSCPKDGFTTLYASLVDPDDGSNYFHEAGNVYYAFVGMKNYVGQNKI